jgi:NAD(P)H-hydrate epimerase
MGIRLRPLSRQEVRALDAQAVTDLVLPTLILMENAGRGAAALLLELVVQSEQKRLTSAVSQAAFAPPLQAPLPTLRLPRVLILCGPGNNGGDGGVVARHLDSWGFPVQVVWFAREVELRGDAEIQWEILKRAGVDQIAWSDATDEAAQPDALDALIEKADWLVDGLLGTGLTRPIEGLLRLVVEAVNRSCKPILALDLPSGLDADRGVPLGVAIRAQATATFVAPKLGFSAPGAPDYTGEVVVVDIGLPRCLLRSFEESAGRSG